MTFLASGSQLVHSTQGPRASLRQLLITATHTTDSSSSCSLLSPKHFGSRQELQERELRGAAFVILLLAWERLWFLPGLHHSWDVT